MTTVFEPTRKISLYESIESAFSGNEEALEQVKIQINHIAKTRPYLDKLEFEENDDCSVIFMDDNFNPLSKYRINLGKNKLYVDRS
jgi:hypothetical protein